MKGLNIAIDASRNRSGGAKIHLIGILSNMQLEKYNINEVHVWSHKELLNELPNLPWLKKHCPFDSKVSLVSELYWQNKILPNELKEKKIDILLNTDAGSVCYFKPSITMSRDMLSYEPGEMKRFGFSFARLRLLALKYVQKKSLLNADGVIFLTEYASAIIQNFTGKIKNYKIINHGISDEFRIDKDYASKSNSKLQFLYVSNVSFYKHQWNVVEAFSKIPGREFKLTLAGGLGAGKAKKLLEKSINKSEKNIELTGHIKHEDVPKLLKDSDIFIFASSCENMPNTLVEAMASGIPIACSNRGPMPEILRDGGIYFDPENVDSIKDALELMINDTEMRLKLATKSKHYSNDYSWKICSEKTFNYLSEIYYNFHKKYDK